MARDTAKTRGSDTEGVTAAEAAELEDAGEGHKGPLVDATSPPETRLPALNANPPATEPAQPRRREKDDADVCADEDARSRG